MICIGFSGLKFINNIEEENQIKDIFKKIFKQKDKIKEDKDIKINKLIQEYQQTKNELIFNEIYHMYEPLINNMARAKDTIELSYSSELSLALYNAVINFNVDNVTNANFNTFFLRCAQNQINVINNSLNAQKRIANKNTISLQMNNSTSDNKEATLEDILEDIQSENTFNDIEFNMVLESIMKHLKDDEKKAVNLLLKGYTLKEIGDELNNITAPAVFTKLRRLRNNKKIRKELLSLM